MNPAIPLSTPDVGPLEEAAIVAAFRSGWVAPAGPELALFEEALAAVTARQHAVVTSSGTAAIHLALICHGVRAGDIVVCSTLTFAATVNAILYTGAVPFLIDSDETGNMDPHLLERGLSELRAEGASVAAVMPVDLLGKVADYTTITGIAGRFGVPVIADAAEALGASRAGAPAGSFGRCAAVSFNGNKIVTSSGGGALLCDDPEIAARARYLSTQARQPVSHYEHTEVGYNYRMSNILAALGRTQLTRLSEFVAKRTMIRRKYRMLCDATPGLEIFGGRDDATDNCWLTAILVDQSRSHFTADELAAHLIDCGIETRPLWKPMHLQPLFRSRPDVRGIITGQSEEFFRCGITLPSGSALTETQIEYVTEEIDSFSLSRKLAA